MERHFHQSPQDSATIALASVPADPAPGSRGFAAATTVRVASETRGALLTCVLAMYPLVGSATIILAAIMLAGGARAG